MGMYTELYVKAVFKENLPNDVVNIIEYMLGMGDIEVEDLKLPNHELFKTQRWEYMLRSASLYHIPFALNKFIYNEISENYFLVARADFKNYNGEVGKFFDWLKPYLQQEFYKTLIGYSLHEEATEPTIYYLDGIDEH